MNESTREEALLRFLQEVDADFPVPLSQKQDLARYARKLLEHATLCTLFRGETLTALAAGYTDNTPDRLGYLSIAATAAQARGQGYAPMLVRQFLDIARSKGLDGVHLYAVASNLPAVRMYRALGFRDHHPADEPRPGDLHLIYRFEWEDTK